jgi:hypothetical protein
VNRTQIINNTLKEFRQNVPDYVGCGFVDMSTGMLLAVDTVADHPREILDIVAAATADLFDGKSITQIEELWKEYRGVTDGGHYFKEILVNSDNLVHLFMRGVTNQDIVAVVICTRKVSIGMLFAQARQVMREFEAARLSHNVCRIRSSRGPEPVSRRSRRCGPSQSPRSGGHPRTAGADAASCPDTRTPSW